MNIKGFWAYSLKSEENGERSIIQTKNYFWWEWGEKIIRLTTWWMLKQCSLKIWPSCKAKPKTSRRCWQISRETTISYTSRLTLLISRWYLLSRNIRSSAVEKSLKDHSIKIKKVEYSMLNCCVKGSSTQVEN